MIDLLDKHGITFDAEQHRYTRFGQRVMSVTSALPYVKNEWLSANPQVMEKAGDRGHGVARFIEHVESSTRFGGGGILGGYLSNDITGHNHAYLDFKQQTGFGVCLSPTGDIASELFVYHDLLDYCGRLDVLGICENLNKDVTLIDVKATALIPKTVGMQTAAYLEAYNRNAKDYGLPKAKRRACLHLNPKLYKCGWKLEPLTDPKDFGNFMSLLNSHRIAKEFGCTLIFQPFDNQNDNQVIEPMEAFA